MHPRQRCDAARRRVGDVAEETFGLGHIPGSEHPLHAQGQQERKVILDAHASVGLVQDTREPKRGLRRVAVRLGEQRLTQRRHVLGERVAFVQLRHDQLEVDRLAAGGADEHHE